MRRKRVGELFPTRLLGRASDSGRGSFFKGLGGSILSHGGAPKRDAFFFLEVRLGGHISRVTKLRRSMSHLHPPQHAKILERPKALHPSGQK